MYEYRCNEGHYFLRYAPLAQHSPTALCGCGIMACQLISAPAAVKVAQNVAYDSPITGAPITSWAARTEDLKRNHCRPYEEGMRQDHERQLVESERVLEQSIEQDVERSIEKMPNAKRGQLYNELTRAGIDAVVQR